MPATECWRMVYYLYHIEQTFCRYDIELFLRIEQLLGQKIPVYEPNIDSVKILMERVSEAQRYAKLVSSANIKALH